MKYRVICDNKNRNYNILIMLEQAKKIKHCCSQLTQYQSEGNMQKKVS